MTTGAEPDGRGEDVLDPNWLEDLHNAGIQEWPRAAAGDPVNEPRMYYLRDEVLVDEPSRQRTRGFMERRGDIEEETFLVNDQPVTVLRSPGSPDRDVPDALDLSREMRWRDEGLRVSPHYVAMIAQGRPGISPATHPRRATGPLRTEHPIPGTKQCIAVVDTGLWASPPEELTPVNEVYALGETEIVRNEVGEATWRGAGHGGFIGGIVAARAKGVPMYLANGFDESHHALTIRSIIEMVDKVLEADPAPTVVNLSLGTYTDPDLDIVGLREAVERWATQVLIVAAAGNHSTSKLFYPAAMAGESAWRDRIVSVGALETTEEPGTFRPASYSNFGDWVTAWAPGEHESLYPQDLKYPFSPDAAVTLDGFASWAGTSFAAPFAASEIVRHAIARNKSASDSWVDIRGSRPWVVFT